MTEKSYIPVFTGADYKGWAFKIKFGLADKELHDIVMNWGKSPRQEEPAVFLSHTQNELDRDRLGMEVGREVVVCQDLGIDEVARCPGVDQHPDRYGWEGIS